MVERKNKQPQIVVLNTNLMRKDNDEEATQQWIWLNKTLEEFQKNDKTVS